MSNKSKINCYTNPCTLCDDQSHTSKSIYYALLMYSFKHNKKLCCICECTSVLYFLLSFTYLDSDLCFSIWKQCLILWTVSNYIKLGMPKSFYNETWHHRLHRFFQTAFMDCQVLYPCFTQTYNNKYICARTRCLIPSADFLFIDHFIYKYLVLSNSRPSYTL